MNNEIKLHTIAVYNNKEYELQDLLNGMLNKLNIIEEYIKELDDETDDTCLYQITKETKEKLMSILRGDKLMNNEIKEFNEELYVEMLENGELYDYITNLQKENERLKTKTKEQSLLLIDYQDMEQKLEHYKSRIEKVVGYIKEHEYDIRNDFDCYVKGNELLDILYGRE